MAGEAGSPSDQMLQMISGFWVSRALYVAAQLGFADHLHDQPRTAAELAKATGAHAASVYRVLRALAGVGVFVEDEQGRFSVTPLGATLRSAVPGSQRALAISELGGGHYTAWGDVLHSVQTGEIAFDHVFGTPVWDYYAAHPEEAQVFNDSMTGLTRMVEAAVLFIDLIMLVMTGGRERTEQEFRNLLAAAGFTLTRVLPTRSPFSVVEAIRIDN